MQLYIRAGNDCGKQRDDRLGDWRSMRAAGISAGNYTSDSTVVGSFLIDLGNETRRVEVLAVASIALPSLCWDL